jgi:hypothetical protein
MLRYVCVDAYVYYVYYVCKGGIYVRVDCKLIYVRVCMCIACIMCIMRVRS